MQLAGVIRHRPVLMVVAVDQLVKPLEQLELAAYPAGRVIVKLRVAQQQGEHRLRQQRQGMFPPRQLRRRFPFNQPPVVRQRRQLLGPVGQRQADARQTESLPRAG